MGASAALKDIQGLDKGVDKLKGTMGSADKGIDKLSAKFTKFGDSAKKTAKKLNKISIPAMAIGGAAVKMAVDVDTAQRKVSTLWDTNAKSLSQMKKDMRSISDDTGYDQTEVAEGMYQALSSGVGTPDVSGFVKSMTTLADAGFTELPTAIDVTTTIMNAYGKEMYTAAELSDKMVKVQDKGKITVDEFANTVGRVIPNASAAGVSFDDLGASYAIMTAQGQNANISTTNLNSMIAELSSSGSKANKTLKKVTKKGFKDLAKEGKSLGDILSILDKEAQKSGQSLNDMFGSQTAGSAALTLMSNGLDGYNDMLKEVANSEGIAQKNAEKNAGVAKKLRKALTAVKNALIDVGEQALPYVEKGAELVSKLAKKFGELSPATKDFIMKAVGMAAIGGPALNFISNLSNGVGGLLRVTGRVTGMFKNNFPSALMGLNPKVMIAMIAIGGLIGVGVALYKNWDKVKEKAGELANSLDQTLTNAAYNVSFAFADMKREAKNALSEIREDWNRTHALFKEKGVIRGVISIIQNRNSQYGVGGAAVSGSSGGSYGGGARGHATGLNRVPYDEYPARLHRGEIVLPKRVADSYREQGGNIHGLPSSSLSGGNTQNFNPTINITVNSGDENIAQQVAQATRNELDKMFNQLRLQRV